MALSKDTLSISPPLLIANGSTALVPSASSSSSSSAAAVSVGTSDALARSSSVLSVGLGSGEVIPVPSVLSPGRQIAVPLIRWADVAPDAAHTRAQTLKAEFHAQVKSFFRNAKDNIDELAAELFYDDEAADAEDDGEGEEGADAGGAAASVAATPDRKRITTSVPGAEHLGSPRKTELLQQLMSLSKGMDEGLSTFTAAAREAATKAAKENKQHAAANAAKHRLTKNEMAQLAAMTREMLEGTSSSATGPSGSSALVGSTPRKSPGGGVDSKLSDDTKAALAAFVRRQQLPERHRAYEAWVEQKAKAQTKVLAKAEREAKQARLKELEAARLAAAQATENAERERARAEEEALRRELEAQARAEAAEEAARLAEEEAERARLERERKERDAARRAEREAELARIKLEEEMAARALEQRQWEAEKHKREQQENDALRLTEELKKEVARDLARATQQTAALGAGDGAEEGYDASAGGADEEARAHEELDALFAAADATQEHGQDDGPDTDEEFADLAAEAEQEQFEVPRARVAAGAASARLPPATAQPALPGVTAPSAIAGRKGRTVARSVALPPSFPAAPSLPSSAAAAALQGSPGSASARPSGGGGGPRSMQFGSMGSMVAPSTNYRFERAKRMHGR